MAIFDDREKQFEQRYKHDQELQFKVTARRNRMLGLWAAERMGLAGDAAQAYAQEIADAQYKGGDRQVIAKLVADLAAKGQPVLATQVKFELDHFAVRAKQQISQE